MKRLLVLLSVLMVFSGCSGRDVTGLGFYGRFHLLSVNGALPTVISQTATEKDEVTSGAAALNPDGTWSVSLAINVTAGASVTQTDSESSGTWTQTVNGFTLRDSSSGAISLANYNDGGLTIVTGGMTFIYQQNAAPGFCSSCL